MVNKWIGMGYLSADPKFSKFKNGKRKCNFSLGITMTETLWIEVEAWDKIADNCKKFLSKGSLIFVDTTLKLNTWKNKEGNNQSKIIAVINFMKVINSKKQNLNSINFNVEKIESTIDNIDLEEAMNDLASQEEDEELDSIAW